MDARNFFESRGHAAALGASAVLFAAVAAHAALGGDAERDAASVRASAAGAAVVSNPAPKFATPDYSSISVAWSTSAVTEPDGKRAFVSAPKPRVIANVRGRKPADAPPDRILPAPPVPEATAAPGRVSLRWTAVATGSTVAAVSEIRMLRRGPGDNSAVLVATLKGDATAWEDADVKPRAVYEYRLVVATAQLTKDGRKESGMSAAAQATCPAGADIRFTAGSEGNAAIVIVRKWLDGEWLEQSFTAFPRNEERAHDGAIGGFAVREGKRVDFACGFTLLSIRREIRRFTVPFQEREIVKGVLQVREVRREMSRELLRIEFIDDTGATRKLWKEGDLPENAEPLTENDR
ncbi:MAG: hypothetical protein FD180_1579 [Planctomycetota bacterium]|nr:MAG: hypothetical protein FD180_1579 [Planctomycetota bacterium]